MPLNILLLVVDSLRARSLGGTGSPQTPFFDALGDRATSFRRAYAAECWTLPSHVSMFTGLLPWVHGAHFQHMGYTGTAPTIAEILTAKGYHTEVVTRNFMFDGTMPGVTRGFQVNTQRLSELRSLHPFNWILALTKPRSRRLIRTTGFFHPRHRDSREFLARYSRAMIPADRLSLDHLLLRIRELRERRARTPFFLFCNLYDVHWPYPPAADSVLSPLSSARGWIDNAMLPFVLPSIGSHGYLRPHFRLSERSRRFLVRRYDRAIELMDEKLAHFFAAADPLLSDDTVVIVTSDHGGRASRDVGASGTNRPPNGQRQPWCQLVSRRAVEGGELPACRSGCPPPGGLKRRRSGRGAGRYPGCYPAPTTAGCREGHFGT